MNIIKFDKIAKIYSGIRNTSFKNKEENYSYKLITLNHENNFQIDMNKLENLKTDKQLDDKYLLKKGDIIMRLTPPYTSRIIEFDEDNITTTSNYAIIKVNEKYSPEILTFYLNSEYIQKQIYQAYDESSIKVINISNIKKFNIIEIQKEKEETYKKLITNFKKKKRLTYMQLELEEDLLEEIIFGE